MRRDKSFAVSEQTSADRTNHKANIFARLDRQQTTIVSPGTTHIAHDKDYSDAKATFQDEGLTLEDLLRNNRQWASSQVRNDPEYFTRLVDIQRPKLLWIGCSDSRVPANEILGLAPGEVFVHRNIANVVTHSDLNAHSVIQYSVEVLKVRHVIVTGHYNCGGVKAAMTNQPFGLIDWWLHNIKDVYEDQKQTLDALPEMKDKQNKLCELNVVQSVINVAKSSTVQKAWAAGQEVSVVGWCYRLDDGLIKDLGVSISSPDDLDAVYKVLSGTQ